MVNSSGAEKLKNVPLSSLLRIGLSGDKATVVTVGVPAVAHTSRLRVFPKGSPKASSRRKYI
jgi:hypothetical protein